MHNITFRSEKFFDEIVDQTDKHVHLILIATKPDIIKQVPLYRELKKRGHTAVLGHTGQHYDENLSGGMLKEFDVVPDFNLNVRGPMHEVVSQIIGRLGDVIGELKRRGKTVIPYVHGDTTTAMAASNAGFCHGFASVHVEAGIRTLTPDYENCNLQMTNGEEISQLATRNSQFDVAAWHSFLMNRKNWKRGSLEPYPEQFNTRCSEAATGIHLAPVELDREFMLGEGFPEDRIFVVGNSVADATKEAMETSKELTVFERYPSLTNGDFVRFCIHRRENCMSQKRFRAIYDAMVALVHDGRNVLLISMIQTEAAFERFGLKQQVHAIANAHPNFLYSTVWPEYRDVVAVMQRASVCATDSGSMQEEMNILGVPCVTLRFGSDRSESAIAGGNLIAPPIDGALVKSMIEFAWGNAEMRKAPKLYGENVSAKCIDCVENVLREGEVFRDELSRLRF
ncbi:UDP-N-acetylglucosamine 2-epimerase [Candidatus Peregrinibacteria bacterium]|nr:UDP-N-acetylglucosamine 2-epimerase [Candidatus Peregrinibacteria bacterium]